MTSTESQNWFNPDVRRENRRIAFNVMQELASEHGHPEQIDQMRIMVRALGVDETLRRCNFERIAGPEQMAVIRLAYEYLLFEEAPATQPATTK